MQVRDPNRRSMSVTPEGRRRSPASRESLDRCTRMMATERERMKEVWCRMGKEQAALLEARDGMLKLTAKGTTELWRLKTCMADQVKDFEKRICAANSEDTLSRERREEAARIEEVARRRPLSNREHTVSPDMERAGHRPNKEATPATVGCAGC